jgi:DNA polymerase-3 subunit epsilon
LIQKIIEIGILIYDGNKIIETFQSLINPQKKVDYFVQKLTGIKEKELKSCKTFKDHAKEIKKTIKK